MPESNLLLEIKNLKKTYHSKSTNIFGKPTIKKALDDVSFYINKGEIFGIVGESGCGKSTLGRAVVGLTTDVEGEILLDGENVEASRQNKNKHKSEKVQIVFQDPLSSLNPTKRIGWILEEPLKVHKLGNKEERTKSVNEMLELIGLDVSYRNRYPNELSGGQRQRISIGAALMLKPDLIIADEPVSALDVSVQAQILNLMKDLHERLNLSYLFISHDLNVVYYMCDRVGVMYLGKIVELASVDEIYDNSLHPYTKALLSAIPEVSGEKKVDNTDYIDSGLAAIEQSGNAHACAFYPRCPIAADVCKDMPCEGKWLKDKNGAEHFVRCHFA